LSLMPISQARKLLGEPAKQTSWELLIPNPPPSAAPFILGVTLRVRSTVIPGFGITPYVTTSGPYEFRHPGKKTFPSPFPLRFEEGHKFPVRPVFNMWAENAQSELAGTALEEHWLGSDVWLRLLSERPEETVQLVHSYHFINAWPEKVENAPVSYDSEGLVFFDVQMAYDFWRWEPWPF